MRPAPGGIGGGPLSSGWVTTRDTSATANPGPGLGVRVVGVCLFLAYSSVGALGCVTQQRPAQLKSELAFVAVVLAPGATFGTPVDELGHRQGRHADVDDAVLGGRPYCLSVPLQRHLGLVG